VTAAPTLRFLDPATGRVLKRLRVEDNGAPIRQLNELELVPVPIDGGGTREELWANIWHQDRLVRIDPANGRGARLCGPRRPLARGSIGRTARRC
jgi:glutamine cyclotransferase